MKKFLLAFTLVLSLAVASMTDASAARFGGGSSFGRQSSNIGRIAPMQRNMMIPGQQSQRPAGQSQTAGTGAATQNQGRWGGMLGGALMGFGLGALLSRFGMGGGGGGFFSTLLMLGIIFYVVRFFLRRFSGRNNEQDNSAYSANYQDSRYQDNSYQRSITPEIGSGLGGGTAMPGGAQDNWGIPADFDTPAFLRSSKTYFLRLQAAWDKGDINDIHEFTTPEMFAEVRLQLQERGSEPNVTDVIELNAELLGIETFPNEYMASVKFSGKICEKQGGTPEAFEEIWNFTRPVSQQSGWVLAGIQQV